jgi:Na+-transporting NADH:ubiquinone oxidoreductase subunit C
VQTNSNSYTIIYALIMTTIVAVGLALASTGLKEKQDKNVEIATKRDILKSVKLGDAVNVQETYARYIKGIVVNYKGEEITKDAKGNPLDAYKVDTKAESKKPLEERLLPIFKYTADNGEVAYIVPLRGSGLWDEIWGFVAIKDDFKTVFGASFDHKAETPGLGAEISTRMFYDQFPCKVLFDENGNYTSVQVVKSKTNPEYQVDGISGGTMTSNGVTDMLYEDVKNYLPYFEKLKKS